MRIPAIVPVLCVLLASLAGDALGATPGKRQLWGAIAYHSARGAYGYAVDQKSRRDAEIEAVRQCGSDCDVIRTFRNACGAIADEERHFAWDTGASREIAEPKVLAKCGGPQCKITVWACTREK